MMRKTTIVSLGVQSVTLVISLFSLFFFDDLDVFLRHNVLHYVFVLEISIQAIELLWYAYFASMRIDVDIKYRYYDWFFSTPIMIFQFILILEYLENPDNSITRVCSDSYPTILSTVLLNQLMLALGLLSVKMPSNADKLVIAGFCPFAVNFALIFGFHAKSTTIGTILWAIMTLCWGLYGVAVRFSRDIREDFLNVLDILSKNVFGILLLFILSI